MTPPHPAPLRAPRQNFAPFFPLLNSAYINATPHDFGAKTLTGKITQNAQSNLKFNPIDIAASINGNHFSSKDDATVKTTGSFYGDNARELGGIFQDSTQVLSGSYGAIRTN